jgi:hypothetical protein
MPRHAPSRNAVTPDYTTVTTPTVFWAGWDDIFLNGQLDAFEGFQKATNGKSWLFIDAEGHCQDAHADYPRAGIEGRAALGALLGISLFLGELDGAVFRLLSSIYPDTLHLVFILSRRLWVPLDCSLYTT